MRQEALRYGAQAQQIFDMLRQNKDAQAQMRAPIYEEKVVDLILSRAQVTDKPVGKDELMAEDELPEGYGEAKLAKKPAKAAKAKAAPAEAAPAKKAAEPKPAKAEAAPAAKAPPAKKAEAKPAKAEAPSKAAPAKAAAPKAAAPTAAKAPAKPKAAKTKG